MLAAADFNKGLKASQSGDFEIALAEWLPLAEQGNAKAQFNLGLMYQSGKGVKQNDKTAFRWLKLAGKQELVHAQFIVGVMYQLGIGTPISDELAATWYERATIKGDAKAQYNLGVMHELGVGVPQNHERSLLLYGLSAQQGSADAQYNLGVMYEHNLHSTDNRLYWNSSTHNDIESSKLSSARDNFSLSPMAQNSPSFLEDNGEELEENWDNMWGIRNVLHDSSKHCFDPDSPFDRGYMPFSYGVRCCISGNEELTLQSFSIAARPSDRSEDWNYGFQRFEKGGPINDNSAEANITEANKWYTAAAIQGHELALKALKDLWHYGQPQGLEYASKISSWIRLVISNPSKYFREFHLTGLDSFDQKRTLGYLKSLAERGHVESQFTLGSLYLGFKLKQNPKQAVETVFYPDPDEAIKWLTLCAEQNYNTKTTTDRMIIIEAQTKLGSIFSESVFGSAPSASLMWCKKAKEGVFAFRSCSLEMLGFKTVSRKFGETKSLGSKAVESGHTDC